MPSAIAWMSATVAVEVSECTTTASFSALVGHRVDDGGGIGRAPPLALEHGHVGAEGLRHRHPAVAEGAGGDAQHAIARLDQVREDRLERAGAGGREQQHVVLGAEDELELAQHLAVGRDEGRAAVVLLRLGLDASTSGGTGTGPGVSRKG